MESSYISVCSRGNEGIVHPAVANCLVDIREVAVCLCGGKLWEVDVAHLGRESLEVNPNLAIRAQVTRLLCCSSEDGSGETQGISLSFEDFLLH